MVFLLLFLAVIAVVVGRAWWNNRRIGGQRYEPVKIMPRTQWAVDALDLEKAKILLRYMHVYRHLDNRDRAEFLYRVELFIKDKEWSFRDDRLRGHEFEIQTVVAGAAVQITFGLPTYTKLSHFHKIVVLYEDYYSKLGRAYHKGEVHPRSGLIILSWKHILKGFADSNDALNLALHEMAHAVRFEHQLYQESLFHLGLKKAYNERAEVEHLRVRNGQNSFLREYGGVNEEEFFSVVIEAFFEQPHHFAQAMPKLYPLMMALLNQDPREYMPAEY